MKINNRLKKIGDLVEANSFCLDVGCDHAFLDIYLVERNDNIRAIASDVKEGPLNQARENIKKYHLEDKIECRLGDGLDTYSDDVDTIIISGMGGRGMIGIFKNHFEVLKKVDTIILSPNNYQIDVKKFLFGRKVWIMQIFGYGQRAAVQLAIYVAKAVILKNFVIGPRRRLLQHAALMPDFLAAEYKRKKRKNHFVHCSSPVKILGNPI